MERKILRVASVRMFLFVNLVIIELSFFFFFQAEDGIRDRTVTGVQTCALPILVEELAYREERVDSQAVVSVDQQDRRGAAGVGRHHFRGVLDRKSVV